MLRDSKCTLVLQFGLKGRPKPIQKWKVDRHKDIIKTCTGMHVATYQYTCCTSYIKHFFQSIRLSYKTEILLIRNFKKSNNHQKHQTHISNMTRNGLQDLPHMIS